MTITSLHIKSFGCLRDYAETPGAGLNRYIRPNEAGKTTLIQFICFMLFGYDAKRHKTYFPWDGSPLSGSLTLEQGGRHWRIERTHPAKGADKRQVFCEETGEELHLAPREQPAQQLLKIDLDTFLRSFCVTQGDLRFARTDGLDVALRNLASTGDETVSAQQAEALLLEQQKRYQYRGRQQGPLTDLRGELAQLRVRQAELLQSAERSFAEIRKAEQLNEAEQRLLGAQTELNRRLAAARGSDALRILEKLNELKQAEALPHPAVEKDRLQAWLDAEQAQLRGGDALSAARARRDQCRAQCEELRRTLDQSPLNGVTPQALQARAMPWLVAAVCWAAAVAMLLAGLLAPLPLLLPFAAAPALLGLLPPIAERRRVRALCRAAGAESPAQLQAMLARHSEQRAQLALAENEMRRAEQAAEEAERAADQAAQRFNARKEETRLLTRREVQEMLVAWGVYETTADPARLTRQRALLLGGRSEEEWRKAAEGAAPVDDTEQAVLALLQANYKELSALRAEKDQRDPAEPRRIWAEFSEISRLVQEKTAQEREWTAQLAAVQQGLEWLQQANAQMSERFAPRLCALAGAHLAALTGGRYSETTLDPEFNIRIRTPGASFPADCFSTGTRDALYFAFRLAACDLLAENPLPMILDDPFVNLDPARAQAAAALLKRAAAGRQILYFSCR